MPSARGDVACPFAYTEAVEDRKAVRTPPGSAPAPWAVRALAAAGALAALVLLALDAVLAQAPVEEHVRRLFDITRERNVPTAVSVAFMLAAALAAALAARRTHREGGRASRVALWGTVAAFFAYMALDDALQLHEQAATSLAGALEAHRGHPLVARVLAFPGYYWPLFFLPVFGALGLLLLTFVLRELPPGGPRRMLLAGLACYVVAVIMDFAEGADAVFDALAGLTASVLTRPELQHLMRAYEEAIEIVGTGLLGAAMLARAHAPAATSPPP